MRETYIGYRWIYRVQWRREGGEGGHAPLAALCRGRHLEGRKYGILKFGRFWRIGLCIADSD